MLPSVIIVSLTSILMIIAIIFFPKIKLRTFEFSSYWVVVLIGALTLLVFNLISWNELISSLGAVSAINPLKILILFLSFTVLSIYLDEIGFFAYLASYAASKAKQSQTTLFLYLYVLTSILTVFTANDIIILTFTPFIAYFAKNAKINPLPYLVAEFVAANTWSMLLIIGNPTNIYLATAFGIDFIDYFQVMAIPSLLTGLASYFLLRLVFNKTLSKPLSATTVIQKPERISLIIGLTHLIASTLLLIISSYVNLEMWVITLFFATSLFITSFSHLLIVKKKPTILLNVVRRMPWALVPFVLGMTTLVIALNKYQVTDMINNFLSQFNNVASYGITSFLFSNLINNIPMSILYTSVLGIAIPSRMAVYATIIGSNLGAIFTPVGALAGIMWMSILKDQRIKYSYLDFFRYGLIIGIPLLVISLVSLSLVL